MQKLRSEICTYGMKPPWNVALRSEQFVTIRASGNLHQVSCSKKWCAALQEELHRGYQAEDTKLDRNPHIGSNSGYKFSNTTSKSIWQTYRFEISCEGNSATRKPTREMVCPIFCHRQRCVSHLLKGTHVVGVCNAQIIKHVIRYSVLDIIPINVQRCKHDTHPNLQKLVSDTTSKLVLLPPWSSSQLCGEQHSLHATSNGSWDQRLTSSPTAGGYTILCIARCRVSPRY